MKALKELDGGWDDTPGLVPVSVVAKNNADLDECSYMLHAFPLPLTYMPSQVPHG